MSEQELLKTLSMSVWRSLRVSEEPFEKNRVRRDAKRKALSTVAGDIAASLRLDETARKDFLAACGF